MREIAAFTSKDSGLSILVEVHRAEEPLPKEAWQMSASRGTYFYCDTCRGLLGKYDRDFIKYNQ